MFGPQQASARIILPGLAQASFILMSWRKRQSARTRRVA
jgi:hypothetical protein